MIRSLKVFSTLGVLAPLRETIIPEFAKTSDCAFEPIFNPTNVLADQIEAGEKADVIIAISDMVGDLVDKGILLKGSTRNLASTSVGLAKQIGTPPLAIASNEKFIATLLSARSICFSQTGASGVFFRSLISRLGISEQINAKAKIIQKGLTAETLLNGEAELAVQQLSELLAVPGVDVIGPFPSEFNHTTVFTAGIFADSKNQELARQFLEFIVSDFARAAYVAGGLEVTGP